MLLCIVSKYRGFGAFSMNKTGSWRKLFRTYASVASQGAGSQHLLKPLFGMKLETVYNDGHCGIIDLDEVCIRTRWESVGLKYVVKDLYPSIFLDAENSQRKNQCHQLPHSVKKERISSNNEYKKKAKLY